MIEEILEKEVEKIFEHIKKGENILLSGGAGSGKTYSLVQVIKKAIRDNPTVKVACMTYTNAAVKEIERRVDHPNLSVTTIHDFLWDNIKAYQRELKKTLIDLINDEQSKIKGPDDQVETDYYDNLEDGIQYKEWTRIKDGIISHDEVIELANEMYKNYPLLCDILKDKFKFIFIDEYQDTHPSVVQIFLVHLNQSKKKNIIGFFGDAMQAIYDDVIGDLKEYIDSGAVIEIQKKQNRRNPISIIDLANRLRNDGLVQEPSIDIKAPNMFNGTVKEGSIKFIYSQNSDIENIKKAIGWDFENAKETKELNLTHNLIAPKAGFNNLMEIYDGDEIIKFKKRITDYIKRNLIATDFTTYTFGQVIEELRVPPTASQQTFMEEFPNLYSEAKNYPFDSFKKIYLSKEALIDDKKQDQGDENRKGSKRDNLIKHLFKIQSNLHLYKNQQYNEFISKTEYQIRSIQDKKDIKQTIEEIEDMSNSSISDVIDFADEKGICLKDDKFYRFVQENEYVFNRIKTVRFEEFQKLYYYLEGFTPFSTQHKIKGSEFNSVLVVLDNGGWSKYNFEYLLNDNLYSGLTAAKKKSYPGILSRTQKIFYVCCTRAKEQLVVYYHKPDAAIVNKAKSWFGENNVFEM